MASQPKTGRFLRIANLSGTRLSGWTWVSIERAIDVCSFTATHPVLGCLTNESALASACTGITADRISASSHKIVEPGKFDNQGIPVVFIERSFFQIILDKTGLERDPSLFLEREILKATRKRKMASRHVSR